MADSLNTPTLPKLHQALSRRSLMREMAAAGMLAAVPLTTGSNLVPVAAAAAPVPVPSARIRMNLLIEELIAVAREFNPNIAEWRVHVSEPNDGEDRCSVLIAGFDNAEPTGGKVKIDWRHT
jgi:hypothetical protein